MNREALVLPAKCLRNKQLFGIRAERIAKVWHLTWAFPVSEKTAQHEKLTDNKVSGTVVIDESYPGCPNCGSGGFVVCFDCGRTSCLGNTPKEFTCPWCGSSGTIEFTDTFTGIKAGGY